MDAAKLTKFRKKLMELRANVLNRSTASRAQALSINTDDLADENDHAASLIQQSVMIGVQERERFILREIDHALSKFEDGLYGLCEDTEEPIDEARLEAEPYTRYSVEAAEMREKRKKRFAVGGTEF